MVSVVTSVTVRLAMRLAEFAWMKVDGVSLPLQVAITSEGMQLNMSSEETALDTKAEGVERGEIRVGLEGGGR